MPDSESTTTSPAWLIRDGKEPQPTENPHGPLVVSSSDGDDSPPPEFVELYTKTYAKDTFPDDTIRSSASPFAERVGHPLTVIYNGSSSQPTNMRASRLTTDLQTGKFVKICGGALVVSGKAGAVGLDGKTLRAIDNAIHDEVLEYFCQGVGLGEAGLGRIVKAFGEGVFDYAVFVDDEEAGAGDAREGGVERDGEGHGQGHGAGEADVKDELPGWG